MSEDHWRVMRSVVTYEDRWLKVRSDDCMTSDGRVIAPYHVLEYSDWLNAVALTADGRVVLVREYRHGVGRVVLGLPCGTMEPDDTDPEAAMRRELREETGFGGGSIHLLAASFANPANQPNTSYSYLISGVELVGPQSLDPSESIEVVVEPFAPFLGRLWRGEVSVQIGHLAALTLACRALLSGIVPASEELRKALMEEFLGHRPG